MRYKLMGKSGLRVSELCLGTMTFGEEWGWGASQKVSKQLFDTYAGAGGNFIDTANRYTEGTSEKYVGDFIAVDRGHFVVATKYTLFNRKGDPNASGNQRKNMIQSLEASLKRLKTEYIDLYWVHAWDFMTPVEEVMRALDDLVRAGKVLYVGISDTPAWVVSQANTIAEFRGWSSFVGLQIQYSLVERTPERDLLPMARAMDLSVTPWGILGSGVLSGKYGAGKPNDSAQELKRLEVLGSPIPEKQLRIATEVEKIAHDTGRTSSQVAINWIRQQPGVFIPILGATKVSQLEDNLGCLDFELNEDQIQQLNGVSSIELGFPHDFLANDFVRELVFGGTYKDIDNHRA